jgi:hypothetical protein
MYTKKTWITGDVINSTDMNRMEDGMSTSITYSGENVGFGTTNVESWSSDYVALQLGGAAMLMAQRVGAAIVDGAWIGVNAYYDGNWKRINDGAATLIAQYLGLHKFHVSSSDVADSVITWVEVLGMSSTGISSTGEFKGILNLVGTTDTQTLTGKSASSSTDYSSRLMRNEVISTSTGATTASGDILYVYTP